MKLTGIGRNECRIISERALEALKVLEQELGVKVEREGAGKFDKDSYFEFKVRFTLEGADPGRKEFEAYASMFGLEAGDYGRPFVSRGRTFRISGVQPRGQKYPVLATGDDGKTYKFAAAGVIRAIGRIPSMPRLRETGRPF